MMRSVVSGSQQRRRENLRLRAAEVTTNVLIFKHSLTLIVRYFSSHQFTGVHWYSHHDMDNERWDAYKTAICIVCCCCEVIHCRSWRIWPCASIRLSYRPPVTLSGLWYQISEADWTKAGWYRVRYFWVWETEREREMRTSKQSEKTWQHDFVFFL